MTTPTESGKESQAAHGWTEYQIEQFIGRLLRAGVVLATGAVLMGGIMLLAQQGRSTPDYRVFQGTDRALRSFGPILSGVFAGDAQSIIALGIILLIATPVLRVAFMLGAFAAQRDRLYVFLSAVVLLLLLFGLFGSV